MVMIVTVASTGAMLVVVVVMIVVVMIVLMLVTVALVIVMLVLVAVALVVVMLMLMLVAMALVVVMLMLVIVAMALVIVMLMLVIVAMALVIVMIVLMLVTVALVIVMIVLVAMALVVVMLMLVIVAMALVIVMVVMMLVLFFKLCHCSIESILVLHSLKNILSVKLIPRCRNYNSLGVMLSDKLHCGINLLVLCVIGVRKNDAGCIGDLIVVELTEVLHIHLALVSIGNGSKAIELGILSLYRLNRLNNVGELSYSAGLNNHSIGMELLEHLRESLREISNERAADTTRVHLGDLDTRVLKKATVNTDLAKLILNKNDLLSTIRFLNKLLYKRSLSRAEKA